MRRQPRYKLNMEALSTEEWNYVRGLYFSDGNRFVRRDGRKDYRILFFFQGDESELAVKLSAMLESAGLRPRIRRDRHENMFVVWVSSRSLLATDRGTINSNGNVSSEQGG
jgi:hypothetical protein